MAMTKTEFVQMLNEIMQVEGPVCASFFIPTHEVGGEWRGDRIQLKNLIQEAEKTLDEMGLSEDDIDKLLEPARAMLQDESTWAEMRDGLSIFSSTEMNYVLRLPFNVEPQVVIGDRFHIKPTLPWLTRNGQFYILTLSQNRLRLLECDPVGCEVIDLGPTPTSMQEALKYDDPERRLSLHTTEKQGDRVPSGDPAVFHGHGVGSDNDEARLRRYFHIAADGVEDYLAGKHAPLLLYGVEENVAVYREISKYPHVLEETLSGNPDEMESAQIADEASDHMRSYHERQKAKALERFNNHRGTDNVSTAVDPVLNYAFQARVAYLFIALDDHVWGQFAPDSLEIQRNEDPGPERVDLLDLCAAYTLQNGGEVYALPRDEMPVEDSPVAALLRF